MSIVVNQLLQKHPLISDQVDTAELKVILSELEVAIDAGITGSVVEFGCYRGTTSLFIRRLLDYHRSKSEFHVYDSFAGLPEKRSQDDSPAGLQFVAGELHASKKDFIIQFKKAGLRPPIIHKAWFSDITEDMLPAHISFAFLDGDYYESIRDSFRAIESQLTKQSVVIVDDYHNEALPGAQKATDEWLSSRPGATLRVTSSLAVITL